MNNVVQLNNYRQFEDKPSPAMVRYLEKADRVTGLLPITNLEDHKISCRTVGACKWRGLVREQIKIHRQITIQDMDFSWNEYDYYITDKGRGIIAQ